jgi:hypothetical protein
MKSPPLQTIAPPILLLLACVLALPWDAAAQSGGSFNLSWSALSSGGATAQRALAATVTETQPGYCVVHPPIVFGLGDAWPAARAGRA